MENRMSDEVICTHLGDEYAEFKGAVVPPIFENSLHVFPSVEAFMAFDGGKEGNFIYGRNSNPTVAIVEQKIAALERGEAAKCFASGMAAISSAILSYTASGDHIIGLHNMYGPAYHFISDYMKRFNVDATFVKGNDIEEYRKAIQPNTKIIYLESPTSLTFQMQDLQEIAKLARSRGIITIIDNTWSTPLFQKPLTLGIDIVVHTLSKYLGGHSDIIGGVVVSNQKNIDRIAKNERELLGGIIGPFEGWLVMRGIRTLPVRMKAHQENAMKVAKFLEAHPKVKKVNYPGLTSHPQYELGRHQMTGYTGLMSFEMDADVDEIKKFVNRLTLFKIGVSWGGFESLVVIPCLTMNEEKLKEMGASRGIVRIAVGLEKVEELIADLDSSFSAIK